MNLLTRGNAVVGKLFAQKGVSVTAKTGATAASAYRGGTPSGAPTTGLFAVGDFIIDQTGAVWICTVAGTPGTWVAGVSAAPTLSTLTVSGLSTLAAISQLQLNPGTTPTYNSGGTTTIDPTTGSYFTITTATGNSNVALASSPTNGQVIVIEVINDAGGARTLTFTTHFKSSATLVGTASKTCSITFLGNGTDAIEQGRAGAAGGTAGM